MNQLPVGIEIPKLLRLTKVLEYIPICKSSWWAGVKSGRYPASIKIGRSTVWREQDIFDLIERLSQNSLQHNKGGNLSDT